MEIDAQERQEKEILIERLSRLNFKRKLQEEKDEEALKKTAEITMKKLYDEAFELEERKKRRISRLEKRIEEKIAQKKLTKKSEDLINKKVTQSIKTLFSELDDDNDGLICANRIDFSNIDARKLKIMTPVLLEMEENEAVLDLPQFTFAIKRLIEVFISKKIT